MDTIAHTTEYFDSTKEFPDIYPGIIIHTEYQFSSDWYPSIITEYLSIVSDLSERLHRSRLDQEGPDQVFSWPPIERSVNLPLLLKGVFSKDWTVCELKEWESIIGSGYSTRSEKCEWLRRCFALLSSEEYACFDGDDPEGDGFVTVFYPESVYQSEDIMHVVIPQYLRWSQMQHEKRQEELKEAFENALKDPKKRREMDAAVSDLVSYLHNDI